MTENYAELLMSLSVRSDTYSLAATIAIRALIVERDRLRAAVSELRDARSAFFEGNLHDGTEKSPEGYLYAAIEKVVRCVGEV